MLFAGYLLLLIIVVSLVLAGLQSAAKKALPDRSIRKQFLSRATIMIIVWVAYVIGISQTDVLKDFSFPPRVPLLLVLPFFVFVIYFFTQKKFKPLIENVRLRQPVYFQTFRVGVELLIYYTFVKELFPQIVTYEGYNFDLLAGLTAPIIGYMLVKKVPGCGTIALIWNFAGLFLLLNVVTIFITATYFPQWWHASKSLISNDNMLPIALLAGVFMPVAVFMHILSISTLVKSRKMT